MIFADEIEISFERAGAVVVIKAQYAEFPVFCNLHKSFASSAEFQYLMTWERYNNKAISMRPYHIDFIAII